MTAFIQQGTQLVSMFGPTGAVIGAVGAIGGAIYTAFAAASDAAEDATEDAITYAEKLTEVKEAIEALRETTLTAAIEGQGKERTDAVEQARAAFIEQEIILNRLLNTAKGDSAVLNSQLVKGQQKLVEDARTLWKLAEAQKRALEGVKGQAEKREREAELEKQNAEITLKLGIQKAKMISERKKAERDAEKKANEERVKEQEKLLKTLQKNEEKFDEWRKQRAETNVEETRKRGEEAAAQLKKTLKDQQKAYEESMKPIKEFNEKIFGAMEDKLVDFVTTGKMSFKGMADSIIADIARIVIQRQITGPLAAIGESMLTSFASSIKFFADGGSVSGPGGPRTDDIPAMLSNGEFVVNARAAQKNRGFLEAINSGMVPQRFADGGPVSSANTQMMKQGGGGDTVVNIIDQRSGDKAPVETQETRGSNGRRQIAVMIRDTVRRGISSGEYDGALNGRFGSQPATIRRG